MKRMRFLSLLLAALLLTAAAPAMAADGIVTPPGTLPIVTEPVTLTIGIQSNTSVTDWDTNEQTLFMEEETGLNLEFIEIPNSEYITKVNLMIAAGGADLPEVLIGTVSSLSTQAAWGDTGLILPLNDYYDTLTHFFDISIEEGTAVSRDQFLKAITCYDGNIYGMADYSESYNNQVSQNRMLIYQPWLDQLGIDRYSITTTDALYDVLCQFRDNDMNGNGDAADEVPLIACTGTLANLRNAIMNAFVYNQTNYLVAEDGVVDVVFDRDEWREGVRFARRLVVDGLLMPESFTQDATQMTAIQSQADQVVGVVARVSTSNLSTTDPNFAQYLHLMPLEGPQGVREEPRTPSIPYVNMMITTNCKNPEAAFRFGDYMASERITIFTKFGREGVEWNAPEEGQVSAYDFMGYPTVLAKAFVSWADVANFYWANTGVRMYGVKLFFGQAETTEGPILEQVKFNAVDTHAAHQFVDESKMVNGLVYNAEEAELVDGIYTAIQNYVNECWSRFVLGDLDIDNDADWEAFVNETYRMDLEVALGAIQSAYDRMNAS